VKRFCVLGSTSDSVAVHWTTPDWERAEERASAGAFAAAARLAARSAQSRLERFGIASTANADLAVGDLLYAVYYARRAGADDVARRLRRSLQSYAFVLQDAGYRALQDEWPETTRACLVGLFEEWVGDAHLFTGSEAATRYYDRAEPWFRVEDECAADDVSAALPCWGWGAEPQFERPMDAFFEYVEWAEPERSFEFGTGDYGLRFFERLDGKRALAAELTD